MMLRGVEFKPCWDAAGLRGWGGEGYWFHHLPLAKHMYDFSGSTRVAKTTTMFENGGNMSLLGHTKGYAPKEDFPKCIWHSFTGNRTLNAVGLSGPGAHALSNLLFWAQDKEPYMISFMSVRDTMAKRLGEMEQFARLFKATLFGTTRLTKIALQINLSCPNTGLDTKHLVDEAEKMLNIGKILSVPKIIKINLLPPPETVAKIAAHPECDALCFTNALPFGSLPEKIDWKRLFPNGSPLLERSKNFGGGGYSGKELLPLVCEYSRSLRALGVTKPFNLGGGIRSARDIDYAVEHADLERGRDSIFFASAAIVRPWNIRSIIKRADKLLS